MEMAIRLTTESEKDPSSPTYLEPFDNTKLTAINTCPTWGIIRYGHHKAWPNERGTAAALNAGSAAHDVFAASRVWRLHHMQGLPEVAQHTGLRIFGTERWSGMGGSLLTIPKPGRSDYLAFCLEALYNSGLIDDPAEKRKGMAAVEESCIIYLDRYDERNDVFVSDNFVGVEQPFDLVITYGTLEFRFTGKIDAVEKHGEEPWVHENKTASRLNDAWIASFQLAHQVTGYVVAASFLTNVNITNCRVHGLSIPLPKNYDLGGLANEDVVRKAHHIVAWLRWVRHTLDIYEQFKATPMDSPQYTHSCNRFFRPCSLIPYCAGNDETKAEIWDFLVDDEWSPLHETKPK